MSVAFSTPGSLMGTSTAYPDLTAAGTMKYIPEIYSGKLLVKFYASSVFGDITNTDYEGEIKTMGDKVIIRNTPDVAISDYVKGQELSITVPTAASTFLSIDYAKYWNFLVDDVDKFQSDLAYADKWTTDASTQLKLVIDKAILNAVRTQATAQVGYTGTTQFGATGAPRVVNRVDVLDLIVDGGVVMDGLNIPETDRYFVLPAWAIGMLKKSDLKNVYMTGDQVSPLRNGRIGSIDRAMIYSSNQLPTGVAGGLAAGESAAYFGQKNAISFASQLTNTETHRSERTFGTLFRGLQVYGFKVLKPTALGYAVIVKGT
jgi:hypothetical protein